MRAGLKLSNRGSRTKLKSRFQVLQDGLLLCCHLLLEEAVSETGGPQRLLF